MRSPRCSANRVTRVADSAFFGQDAAWQEWLRSIASERMHHAWLFAGARGLGKQAFARAAAARLVGGVDPADDAAIDSHPDIHVLTPLPASDDDAKKKAEGKPYQTKRNISVDQVREMIRKLATRPTLGDRRAIIVDPADDLEKGAVNALLKVLEEPPAGTYFILLAHQPGRLLPTVRSRCRVLRFAPLDEAALDTMLRREVPEADAPSRQAAIRAAQGSPGLARTFVSLDLGTIHDLMVRIVERGDGDYVLRGALAREMGPRPARERQLAAIELARAVLLGCIGETTRRHQLAVIEAHQSLGQLLVRAPTYNFDPGVLIMDIGGLLASSAMPRDSRT
ncbi:DNA polymerase III subunit delta' [Novosphingobium sp. 1949]|uniref:DNA polymerase III subunit delta n=1 Tax=Novosphingobium organovorum TaxID=2930092 RepID=A0ABT0B8S8_9SPHN|nr:DNA polymerase III subunit delta' [Novosphingobium organovorum]MCJ2181403.1 DNA polymerase III subunit delta' [Novosphingobium organovorum]